MRINLYSEELTDEVIQVEKKANGEVFVGIRLILESPQSILDHSTDEDDDRNGVTFWVRPEELSYLRGVFLNLMAAAEDQ